MKRVFLMVLDSLGVGALPDAADFGDLGSHTLASVWQQGPAIGNLLKLGLSHVEGQSFLPNYGAPRAAVARLGERSRGKDTTLGHWEIAGLVSDAPLPTYPDGFPQDVIAALEDAWGRKILCNKPYSGTQVIEDYGKEHMQTGCPIVYTSADSVLQIAAHEDVIPVAELYALCKSARRIMTGKHAVGRVIARPFVGAPGNFTRTLNRKDFSIEPPAPTMLDCIQSAGLETISVGKINDIFAGRGICLATDTHGNAQCLAEAMVQAERDFTGLCFINLVDFDSSYGHRNDAQGYADALSAFDAWLPGFIEKLGEDDVLILTADHGCDPATPSTDHSREYVPMLCYGKKIYPAQLHTRSSFADIAATVCALLCVPYDGEGESFACELLKTVTPEDLCAAARAARGDAYCPYSNFAVGAALLGKNGQIFTGCNVESAAFPAGNCAERVALGKAISQGVREFCAIAICGDGTACPPCGVCRQALYEFLPEGTPVYLVTDEGYTALTMGALLPHGFGPNHLCEN